MISTAPFRAAASRAAHLRQLGTAALLAPALVLAACQDHPFDVSIPDQAPAPSVSRALGLVEITVSGIGTPAQRAIAHTPGGGDAGIRFNLSVPENGDQSGNGSIQLEPVSSGSFTSGERGQGGVRYLYATYRVRNAQSNGSAYDTPRQNLTFVAVSTAGTIGSTPVSVLNRFDGSAASAAVAEQFVPTGAVMQRADGSVSARFADVLQIFEESDLSTLPVMQNADYFPFGFVVSNPANGFSRALSAGPEPEAWDGLVTFAFKVPLQASAADDPFMLSMMFQAVDDATTRVTQSQEEQDAGGEAAFAARANNLGATQVTLLPGSDYSGGLATRTVCDVRTAGSTGAATAEMAPCPGPSVQIVPSTITAGNDHSCGLTAAGAAYCWGDNHEGQLGDGTHDIRLEPTAVVGGHSFTSISAGAFHTVALTSTGQAYAWGYGWDGNLGDGDDTSRSEPTAVVGGHSFVSISAGWYHTVALTSTGEAYAWGWNSDGRLGDGTTTGRLAPTAVAGGHTFTSISAGHLHTVALTSTGAAYAWGANGYGRLGDGTTTQRLVPTAVAGGLTFTSISAGEEHTVALTSAGAAYAWGSNEYGKLGDGTTLQREEPTLAVGGHSFASVQAGGGHTVALTAAGNAYAWGMGWDGQLGDGTDNHRSVPTAVIGGHTFVGISAGEYHTVALTNTGKAYAWGWNSNGQLGDGTYDLRTVPTAVVGGLIFGH